MTAPPVPDQPDAVTDHDLPMLRVHRAWDVAEKIAADHGVNRHAALEIARGVIATIGDGTRRWGRLCVRCRSLLELKDGESVCPQHGRVTWLDAAVLLITFDPIGAQDHA